MTTAAEAGVLWPQAQGQQMLGRQDGFSPSPRTVRVTLCCPQLRGPWPSGVASGGPE